MLKWTQNKEVNNVNPTMVKVNMSFHDISSSPTRGILFQLPNQAVPNGILSSSSPPGLYRKYAKLHQAVIVGWCVPDLVTACPEQDQLEALRTGAISSLSHWAVRGVLEDTAKRQESVFHADQSLICSRLTLCLVSEGGIYKQRSWQRLNLTLISTHLQLVYLLSEPEINQTAPHHHRNYYYLTGQKRVLMDRCLYRTQNVGTVTVCFLLQEQKRQTLIHWSPSHAKGVLVVCHLWIIKG